MTPRIPSLLAFIEGFLQSEFSFEHARALIGPFAQQRANDTEALDPFPGSNVQQAWLEKVEMSGGQVILAGIGMDFETPVAIPLDELIQRLGPAREMPRLHPTAPISFQFLLSSPSFKGYMLLSGPHGSGSPPRSITRLILRRFPPEWV
ncbi:MAG: hypothetical protein NZ898_15330 [Myxococcota bacterium]|nr:hypothetical protein [Myxococcota bacterium]MDW8363939.1 hypothetical protein [Myxococcales bacterium]